MNHLSQHRIVALVLAGVFTIFNVGLPVVIYVCPMMQQRMFSASCCSDVRTDQGPQMSRASDRSCCKTVFAAERNMNEFLQAKHRIDIVSAPAPCPGYVVAPPVLAPVISHHYITASPPLADDDIPIVTSSLLI